MTKEEYKKAWIKNFYPTETEEFIDKHFVVLPCNCYYSKCEGWAMIGNNKCSIDRHKELQKDVV